MKYTVNYNLKKPEGTDTVNIDDFNNNSDVLDSEINSISEQIGTLTIQDDSFREQINNLATNKADLVDGKVPSEQLPYMNYLSPTGDSKDNIVTFTEAVTRTNVATGEKLSILFGRIKKYLTDLKTVAFTGNYSDLSGTPASLPANGGISSACSGNSATATKIQTARNINGVAFDGSQNITISASANGGNADTLKGLTLNTSGINNVANQVCRTNINGYFMTGMINTTSGDFTGTPTRIYASNDAYVRYMTLANFKSAIGSLSAGSVDMCMINNLNV